jgi:hypothetical protein
MEQTPQPPAKTISDQLKVINTVIARLEDLDHESAVLGRHNMELQHLTPALVELDLLLTEFQVLLNLEKIQREEDNIKVNREKISAMHLEVAGLKKKLAK